MPPTPDRGHGIVSTEVLAFHFGCPQAFVYRLVAARLLTPLGRKRLRDRGRPTLWFHLDRADAELDAAQTSGRVVVDQGKWTLRR